jgi:RecB family endonuclease NucS
MGDEMANLILLKGKSETINMNEVKVHPEEEIEKIIFETKNILPDVFLLKRQLQTYSKEDRIDLVGLDNENNVLVIEIKDEIVNESVIPQVLRYTVFG